MDLLEFFDLSKKFERVVVPGSQTGGRIQVGDDDMEYDPYKINREPKGRDYAKQYQLEEDRKFRQSAIDCSDVDDAVASLPGSSKMFDIEDLTSLGTIPNVNELTQEESTQVYENYDFKHRPDSNLQINNFRQKIVNVVESNPVTIIRGATGCGKTTQVPQFILDACAEKGQHCNIIITQPRRIAAISVAKRVSQERKWPLGSVVGYQIGLRNQTSPDTRMTFCTTGVLLQKLINKKHMQDYTHVILDEVHERDQDTDFALLIVKKLLRTNSRNVKVILMSATFNIERFSEYFSRPVGDVWDPAPYIDLDKDGNKKTPFPIYTYYLSQLSILGPLPEIKEESPGITELGYKVAVKLIGEFDALENRGNKETKGAVLVFLPGIYEIEELYNKLVDYAASINQSWWILPLHSTITTDEQESVFRPPPQEHRKIILSTNIAESSITVPDIVYVIDFCLTKHLICDPNTNFTSLQVCWASHSNCTQRAGRSGRVAEGRVYRFVPQTFYEDILEPEATPEILRCPLERLVLQAKLFNMGEPKALLALAMDPPDLTNLENTILLLKEAGALLLESNGIPNKYDGDITFLGQVMAKLPVDISISKLIVLGHVFSVLEECIIMGAAMSLKSVFSTPFQERLQAYISKLTWADSSCSDCVAFLNAYSVWYSNHENGYFTRSVGGGEKSWAKRYFIQLRVMKEVHELVQDITKRLEHLGITTTTGYHRVIWNEWEKPLVLKVVLAGAFYPNFFVRGAQGGQVDEMEAVKQLNNKDPFNSVYFQGLPMNQPGELYAKSIKNYLKNCAEDVSISFDGSSKVYAEFGRPSIKEKDERKFKSDIPGRVSMAVYRAVKLRQLKIPCTLYLLTVEEATKRAEQLGIRTSRDRILHGEGSNLLRSDSVSSSNLPGFDESYIHLQLSHLIDPGHFWASSLHPTSVEHQRFLFMNLNQKENVLKPYKGPVTPGKLCVAPYTENLTTGYYRARIEFVHKSKEKMVQNHDFDQPPDHPQLVSDYRRLIEIMILKKKQVFFIDFGNTEMVKPLELKDVADEDLKQEMFAIPPQAFECKLSEVQPSLISSPHGLWSDEALEAFRKLVQERVFYGKIYSVVNGVVALELLKGQGPCLNVNHWLIEKGYAQRAEESYLSKLNHYLRTETEGMAAYDQRQLSRNSDSVDIPVEPPSRVECRTQVTLRGPNSPLEMRIFNLTRVGVAKCANIEWNSVNSVLLDSEPQDPHDRLLVAASVGTNPRGDSLNLRHTTLMPNIHGLPAILALIFSPSIELRTNDARTRYVGALCGLGFDEITGEPTFPDHDMEITFDSEINLSDILEVNKLRFWMSKALYTEEDGMLPELGPRNIIDCQNKIKEFLFKLLKKRRNPQAIEVARKQFHWNLVRGEHLLHPCEEDERLIFRLHWGVCLEEEDDSFRVEMLEHVKELEKLANKNETVSYVLCKLCQVTMHSTQALRLHLQTAQHKDREEELNKTE